MPIVKSDNGTRKVTLLAKEQRALKNANAVLVELDDLLNDKTAGDCACLLQGIIATYAAKEPVTSK